VIEEVHQAITSKIPGAEILAVDSVSRDNTWAALREMRNVYPSLKIFRLRKPGSCGGCSVRGFMEARGRLIFHREPHCPWSLEIFWDMARLSRDFQKCAVFCSRPTLHNLREKSFEKVLRNQVLNDWDIDIPDTSFPLQLFNKSNLDRAHILLPEEMVASGLALYLLFLFFNQKTKIMTPDRRVKKTDAGCVIPEMYAKMSNFHRCLKQLKKLRKNLAEIQDLMEI